MKRIEGSEAGILDISWSPDSKWVVYTAAGDVRLANVDTGEVRTIGPGAAPRMTTQNRVLFERDGNIILAQGANTRTVVGKNEIVKESPKGLPLPSPDGELMIFVLFNIFDKTSDALNAYPYRHFLGKAATDGAGACCTREQWYGGSALWFPDGSRFAHFEFDSTAGPQVHISDRNGEKEGIVIGLYPSVSPDSSRLAAKPRNGGSVMVYTSKGGWTDDDVTMAAIKLPISENRRPGATPPVWLDNRTLLLIEGDTAYRVDTKKEKAELLKKISLPTERRTPTLIPSPDREQMAMEVSVPGGFELRVGKPF